MSQTVISPSSTQSVEGLQHKRNAGILAIIGLFIAGPILGILALWQGAKANSLGIRATGWMILGVIDIVCGLAMAVALFS